MYNHFINISAPNLPCDVIVVAVEILLVLLLKSIYNAHPRREVNDDILREVLHVLLRHAVVAENPL